MASAALVDLFRIRVKAVAALDAHALHCLNVAEAWVNERVYLEDTVDETRHPQVTEGILILAHRLWSRRTSPEGVSGWGDLGVIRINPNDPDIRDQLAWHLDYSRAGIA